MLTSNNKHADMHSIVDSPSIMTMCRTLCVYCSCGSSPVVRPVHITLPLSLHMHNASDVCAMLKDFQSFCLTNTDSLLFLPPIDSSKNTQFVCCCLFSSVNNSPCTDFALSRATSLTHRRCCGRRHRKCSLWFAYV